MNALEATPPGEGIGTKIVRTAEATGMQGWGLMARSCGVSRQPRREGAYQRLGYTDWGRGEVIDVWDDLDGSGRALAAGMPTHATTW
jgi:hypothetical protein